MSIAARTASLNEQSACGVPRAIAPIPRARKLPLTSSSNSALLLITLTIVADDVECSRETRGEVSVVRVNPTNVQYDACWLGCGVTVPG